MLLLVGTAAATQAALGRLVGARFDARSPLLSGEVWISPGQWGSGATGALLVAGAGWLVVHRAERSDVSWAFLAAYAAILFGRAWWLGDPLAIPLHGLASGAL